VVLFRSLLECHYRPVGSAAGFLGGDQIFFGREQGGGVLEIELGGVRNFIEDIFAVTFLRTDDAILLAQSRSPNQPLNF
jgi:hypothetical protein